MMVRELEVCPSDVSADTLSAWRDGETSPAEARRIAAHVPTCATCQARLTQYETAAASMRAQRVPALDERLWQAVRARIAAEGVRPARRPGVWRPPTRRAWAGLGALAAVALLAVSFATVFHFQPGKPVSHATPSATHGIPTALQLTWTPVTLPAGVERNLYNGFYVVDRDTAYACSPPAPGTRGVGPTFWVSHDRAAHWSEFSALPATAHAILHCTLTVDMIATQNVLAFVSWQHGNTFPANPAQELAYFSADSGTTWRLLSDPNAVNISAFATYQGTVYAQFVDQQKEFATNQPNGSLLASDDGMRTWRRIDGALTAASAISVQFWMRPDTGELLVGAAYSGPSANPTSAPLEQLFDSRDLGTQWSSQPMTATEGQVWVAQPVAGDPWTVCRESYEQTENPLKLILECSTDRGQTWHDRAGFQQGTVSIPPVPTPGTAYTDPVFGLSERGDVLAQINGQVYRLPPGAAKWQLVGNVPTGNWYVYVVGDSQGDVLWAVPPLPTFTLPGTAPTGHPLTGPIYWAVLP